MHSVPYIQIPAIAMLCYIILALAMLSSKKSKIINAFTLYLLVFMLWTGASVLMRMQFYPGYEFWYQVSILSVFSLAFFLYHFLYCYLNYKNHIMHRIWGILTVILLVLTYLEIFLPVPYLQYTENGSVVFLYSASWMLIFPTLLTLLIIVSIIKMVLHSYKKDDAIVLSLRPFLVGSIILVVGNIISVLPGNIFPWDTLSGIINAILAFYVLTSRRIFKLTLLVSRSVLIFISILIATLINIPMIGLISDIIDNRFPSLDDNKIVVQCIIFSVCLLIIYKLIEVVTNLLFMKKEQINNDSLKTFSSKIADSLDSQTILELTQGVLLEGLPVKKVHFLTYDKKTDSYNTIHSSNPLSNNSLSFRPDAPLVKSIESKNSCIFMIDIKKTAQYKAMWEEEKELLRRYNICSFLPLNDDNDNLFGFIALGDLEPRANLDYNAVNFMESVRAISAIGLRNATKYEKAQLEAISDPLTGLLNRSHFLETMNDKMNSNDLESLALILINIDDFRLYNELYGSSEGDEALIRISLAIKNTVGTKGSAARFSGKEFAICLPNKTHLQALNMAKNLQVQLLEINKINTNFDLKGLTFSGGICVYPHSAITLNELITNTNMAVYQAKHSGKNRIITYQKENTIKTYKGAYVDKSLKMTKAYEEYASTIYALTAAIDAKDSYTFNHSQNVAAYASVLAKHAGLNDAHAELIYEAGLLHDIGKIAIPEHILSKPGELNDDEYKIMQSHVKNSIEIIRHLPNLDYLIPAVTGHHERWDGKGYPRALSGDEIPISARCLALADSFDAMISKRSYKNPFTIDFACDEIIKSAGLQFDPGLAFLFVDLVKKNIIYVDMEK